MQRSTAESLRAKVSPQRVQHAGHQEKDTGGDAPGGPAEEPHPQGHQGGARAEAHPPKEMRSFLHMILLQGKIR